MSQNLPSREINILLLGGSGFGKSTTINVLANYFAHSSFKELEKGFLEVIPTLISLADPETGDDIPILSGKDHPNENRKVGESNTQMPMGYVFKFKGATDLEDVKVRLIDTPGIGDTGGIKKDAFNFEKILSFLAHYTHLHAVLFVVRSNDARQNSFFKYCITELLTHLHRSISQNLMFCFTYSPKFVASAGLTNLKSFLRENLKLDIELKASKNCFFLENTWFQYMAALNQGIEEGPQEDKASIQADWNKCVKMLDCMMKNVINLSPHLLQETISLNSVRSIILELAKPIVVMERLIAINIVSIEEEKLNYIKSAEKEDKLLGQVLYVVDDVKLKPVAYKSTVCTSENCVLKKKDDSSDIDSDKESNESSDKKKNVSYVQRCHEKCNCIFVPLNIPGVKMLRMCKCFDWSFNCKVCKCPGEKHMHFKGVYERKKRLAINHSATLNLFITKNKNDKTKLIVEKAEEILGELQKELETLQDVSSKFGYILATNSYLSHNKYFEETVEELIQLPEFKNEVKEYKKLKEEHQERVRILMEAIENQSQAPISINEVPALKKRLLELRCTGEKLRDILNVTKAINDEEFYNYDRKVLTIKSNRPEWLGLLVGKPKQ